MTAMAYQEAVAAGASTYFTGAPCKNGVVAERRLSNRECLCESCSKNRKVKALERRMNDIDASRLRELESYRRRASRVAEYKLLYRENNKEKLREAARKYRLENRSAIAERRCVTYQARRDDDLSRNKAWRDKNREYNLTRMRTYNKKNAEALRAYAARFRRDNPQVHIFNVSKRRAAKLERLPAWFGELDEFVILEASDLARKRESATSFRWHVDHMIPLQCSVASGLHCWNNLQVIPATINARKRNSLWLCNPGEWLSQL